MFFIICFFGADLKTLMTVNSLCSLLSLIHESCNYLSVSNCVKLHIQPCSGSLLFIVLYVFFGKLFICRADLQGQVTMVLKLLIFRTSWIQFFTCLFIFFKLTFCCCQFNLKSKQ